MSVKEADWEGFPARLRRALDRWQGGNIRHFTEQLETFAAARSVAIPTSYRTVMSYLAGETRPTVAWLGAAAEVLFVSPDWLARGEESASPPPAGRAFSHIGDAFFDMAIIAAVEELRHLPQDARNTILAFLRRHFAGKGRHLAGGHNFVQGAPEEVIEKVRPALREHFGPVAAPRGLVDDELMIITSALATSAYIHLADSRVKDDTREP